MSEIIEILKNYKVYIYGAGEVGKEIDENLLLLGIFKAFYLVSVCEKKDVGKNTVSLDYYNDNLKSGNDLILVAVGKDLLYTLESELKRRGIDNYILVDASIRQYLNRKSRPYAGETFIKNIYPVSRKFGCDRGTAIDRYYIEKFLEKECRRIHDAKSIIEVGEDTYSKRYFSGPNLKYDILDYGCGMDLEKPETLSSDKYDVFISTQVFHVIYDVKTAIRSSYQLLKKDGVLIGTVAGNISPISESDMNNYGYYWGFTYLSIKYLLEEIFGKGKVSVRSFGNSAIATAFVQGIALEELPDKSLLDIEDDMFSICIGFTAKK